MYIQVQAGKEQVATYEILLDALQEAVLHMNLPKPIVLDRFLIRNSAFPSHVIPEALEGVTLKLKLIFNEYEKEKYAPNLEYCTGTNLTKHMNEINWGKYFDFEGGEEPLERNKIKIYPKRTSDNECSITVRKNMNNIPPIIYIAYGAKISLKIKEDLEKEDVELPFIMDPLVKVSSNQGG